MNEKDKLIDGIDAISCTSDDPKFEKASERRLVLLGCDITHFSLFNKYLFLSTGMLISMCFYGYFQEFLMYNWFGRKLSIFAALLHFSSYSICTFFERNVLTSGEPQQLQRKLPWICHFAVSIVKCGTQALTNLSMTEVNYPAKVLFKSAMPVVTMVVGVLWFRKKYQLYDYIVVFLLVVGLYIFLCSNTGSAPQWTSYGLFLSLVSLLGSSLVPILQEYWLLKYNASHGEILAYSFYGSTVLSLALSIISGELREGIRFLHDRGSSTIWLSYSLFVLFGFIGAHFAAALTSSFGALLSGITLTARKAVTLGLSFALFPTRNVLSVHHVVGAAVFLAGLLVRSFAKVSHKIEDANNIKLIGYRGGIQNV